MLAMGSCFTSGLTPSSLISRGPAPWLTTLCWARPRPRPPHSVTSAWPPWPRAGLRSLMSRPEAGGQPTPAETASTRPLPSPTPGFWPTVSVTATHQTPTVRAAQRTRWGQMSVSCQQCFHHMLSSLRSHYHLGDGAYTTSHFTRSKHFSFNFTTKSSNPPVISSSISVAQSDCDSPVSEWGLLASVSVVCGIGPDHPLPPPGKDGVHRGLLLTGWSP